MQDFAHDLGPISLGGMSDYIQRAVGFHRDARPEITELIGHASRCRSSACSATQLKAYQLVSQDVVSRDAGGFLDSWVVPRMDHRETPFPLAHGSLRDSNMGGKPYLATCGLDGPLYSGSFAWFFHASDIGGAVFLCQRKVAPPLENSRGKY
jgi:hypothetical protein